MLWEAYCWRLEGKLPIGCCLLWGGGRQKKGAGRWRGCPSGHDGGGWLFGGLLEEWSVGIRA